MAELKTKSLKAAAIWDKADPVASIKYEGSHLWTQADIVLKADAPKDEIDLLKAIEADKKLAKASDDSIEKLKQTYKDKLPKPEDVVIDDPLKPKPK